MFDEPFAGAYEAIANLAAAKKFSNPVTQQIRTAINSTNISKKYNLLHLDTLCKKTQQSILVYLKELTAKLPAEERRRFQDAKQVIDPVKLINTFNEEDRAKHREISIAIDQFIVRLF